jgi:hypothetical protein
MMLGKVLKEVIANLPNENRSNFLFGLLAHLSRKSMSPFLLTRVVPDFSASAHWKMLLSSS